MKKQLILTTLLLISCLLINFNVNSQCSSNNTILGNGPGSLVDAPWGKFISGIGDLDGDGLPDIIIARKDGTFDADGGVYAYSGLTGDFIRTIFHDAVSEKVFSMSVFGDFNSDGYDDVLVNGQVYSGANGDQLADYRAVARDGIGIGDLNDDGIHDIVIGNPDWAYDSKNNVGRVDVLSGLNGDTIRTWKGITDGYRFGEVIAPAGYFNGDNIPDILVGTPGNDLYGHTNRGQIMVLSGASNLDTLFKKLGGSANAKFGQMIAPMGNVNGDSYHDIMAVEEISGEMVIRVLSGGPPERQHLLYTIHEPSDASTGWPSSISNAGDINIDGHNDIIVGDYNFSSNKGRIDIYSGLIAEEVLFSYYDRYGESIAHGFTVAGIGDVDGDGDYEIAVAAPTYRDSADQRIGAVFVYHCFYPNEECSTDDDPDEDGLGNLCDNCNWAANPSQEDANLNGIGDACEHSRDLYVRNDQYTSLTAGGQYVSMHFDTVSTAGTIAMIVTETGPETLGAFELVPNDPPRYFNISTDVTYSGMITISVGYDATGMTTEEEAKVSLMHFEGSEWVDITTERNNANNTLKGETKSLSPFVIGLPVPTAVGDELTNNLPAQFVLEQNYPNPFNPETEIRFNLPKGSQVKLEVFNITGRLVATLSDEFYSAGQHTVTWDASKQASGVYLYRLTTNHFVGSKKMILLK